MIGVFDSGVGGFNALYELRQRLPFADITYFADEANAPYGTKNEDELITLAERDVGLLKNLGATHVLIACCTASTVYERLGNEYKENVIPIISPTVRMLKKFQRVTVIATEATVRSHAFSKEIKRENPLCEVLEMPMQELVFEIEAGSRDGKISYRCEKILADISVAAKDFSSEAIVLGCTHFSHLEREIQRKIPEISVISPAREGALALTRIIKEKNKGFLRECGRTVYIRS